MYNNVNDVIYLWRHKHQRYNAVVSYISNAKQNQHTSVADDNFQWRKQQKVSNEYNTC